MHALCMQLDVVFWGSLAIKVVEDPGLNAEGREYCYWEMLNQAISEGHGRPLMKLALAATWLIQVNHVLACVELKNFLDKNLVAAIKVCHTSLCKWNRLVTAGCN